MTPLDIKILLHYYTSPEDYSVNHDMYDAQIEAHHRFVMSGFLNKINDGDRVYDKTDKLEFYCDYLCNVPEPEAIWVIDNND